MKRKTKVVNIKTYKGDYVYIGRPSRWGNPFKNGTREEIIKKYKQYIISRKDLMVDLPKLDGEVLGCYCKPKPCHGDILVELIEEYKKEDVKDEK